MKTSLKFEGGVELERALAELPTPYRKKKASRDALRTAAEPILRAFKSHTKVLTGHLVESETMGSRLNRRQSRLNRGSKMPVEVYVGTNDPAGVQEEFGNRHQAAHPALRPAWDAEGGERALVRIGDALWSQIEKQAKLAARASLRKARKKA